MKVSLFIFLSSCSLMADIMLYQKSFLQASANDKSIMKILSGETSGNFSTSGVGESITDIQYSFLLNENSLNFDLSFDLFRDGYSSFTHSTIDQLRVYFETDQQVEFSTNAYISGDCGEDGLGSILMVVSLDDMNTTTGPSAFLNISAVTGTGNNQPKTLNFGQADRNIFENVIKNVGSPSGMLDPGRYQLFLRTDINRSTSLWGNDNGANAEGQFSFNLKTAQNVPEPNTIVFFLTGILVLVIFTQKKKTIV